MKKFKKLIVALILGLFCGIGLIFGNIIVKADDNLNNFEVITDIEYNIDNSYTYLRLDYDFRNYLSLFNFDYYNLYGFYFSYILDNIVYDFVSYFSYYRDTNQSLTGDFGYVYNNSSNILTRTSSSYTCFLNTDSHLMFTSIVLAYNSPIITNFQLIKFPSVIYTEEDVENAYNSGYEDAREEVVLKGSPLLNCQISVYDSDNMLLGSEPINNDFITAFGNISSGVLYDYATDYLNIGESGRIEIAFYVFITPNDRLQESINFTNGAFISDMFTSYNWVSSNKFILQQNLVNASKIVKDINLNPNLVMVSFTFDDVANLEFFEYGITSSYYDSIYNNGYDLGYQAGYDVGYNESAESSYNIGYSVGYNDGLAQDFSLGNELLKIASVPFNVLMQILHFEILGIDLWYILCGILTVVVVIWCLKKFK